jgi:3-oxoacyl-[acyl-carrier protein] reductase
MKPTKSIVLAGSKGIGKGIADNLKNISKEIISLSSNDLDTSNITSVENFIKKHVSTDVLVLNTGGPPAIDFYEITNEKWVKYFNQLFLSFCIILRDLKVNDNGYIFLISSYHIREINPKLILSNSLRVGFWSVLKSLTEKFSKKNVTTINIAPGPVDTQRFRDLNSDLKKVEAKLPLGRLGTVDEIGKLVSSIVKNDIKYVNGTTIFFDGGKSSVIF